MSKIAVTVVLSVLPCPPLPNPMFGRLVGACQEPRVGDECSLECDEGYRNLGVSKIQCVQQNSQAIWANQFGLCERSLCPALVPPINGQLTGECSGSKVGGICVAQCTTQSNVATVSLKCMENGQWSGTMPVCDQQTVNQQQTTQNGEKMCSDINPPPNGMTSGICSSAKSKDVCKFVCQEGRKLQGLPSLLCNPDGTWSGAAPTCV